jgi:hypothetical protein
MPQGFVDSSDTTVARQSLMPTHLLRHATLLLGLALAGLVAPRVATAQGACEAMPSGPARTDCFVGRARIANQKSNLAQDKARLQGSAARQRAATGTL